MAGGRKARHVDADLRHDDLSDDVTDPGHRRQEGGALLDRRQQFSRSSIQLGEGALERADETEMQLEHCAMVRGHTPSQRLDEFRWRGARVVTLAIDAFVLRSTGARFRWGGSRWPKTRA